MLSLMSLYTTGAIHKGFTKMRIGSLYSHQCPSPTLTNITDFCCSVE